MSDLEEQRILLEIANRTELPNLSDSEDEDIILRDYNNINIDNNINLINQPIMANHFQEYYLKMIPEFDGEPANVGNFINACNLVMNQFYNANDPNLYLNHFLLNFIQSKLTGQARAIISTKNITDWLSLRQAITENFTDQRDDTSLLSELLTLKQKQNEDALSFSNRCRYIEQLLISNLTCNEADQNTRVLKAQIYSQQTLKAFLGGLRNPLGMVVRSTNPVNIETALKFILSEENYEYRDTMFQKTKHSPNNNSNRTNPKQFYEKSHVPHFQPVQFQKPFPIYTPPRPFPFRSDIPRYAHPRLQQQFQRPNFQRQNFQGSMNNPNFNARNNNTYPQPMETQTIRSRSTRNTNPQRNNHFYNPNPRKLDFIAEELHNTQTRSEIYDEERENFPVPGPSKRVT